MPYSLQNPEEIPLMSVPTVTVDKPMVNALLAEDVDRDWEGMNLRDAVAIPVGLGLDDSGMWFDLDDGSKLWRLRLTSPDALSLELYFNEFALPHGAELYIFDDDGDQVLGAYTHRNNKTSGRFSVDMILGESLNLEYREPMDVLGQGELSILDVAYRYRNVIGYSELPQGGGSDACQVDVRCPESEGWDDQVDATVRVRTRINGAFFWCSGTLMNNTAEDCSPYILTALHCALDGNDMSTQDEFDLYRFYFRYEAPVCGNGFGFNGLSITGCTRLADSNDSGGANGSDFLLVEMTSNPPEDYEPFYAGWNVSSGVSSGGGVCIHHPSGDVKKISTYSSTPSSTGWGIPGTHWLVFWEETESGHGVTEGGSSGSAIFDANGRVIGTLTGGASFCDSPNSPDRYGKMNRHWTSNPNPPEEKLSEWLDPLDLGVTVFDGSADPCDGATGLGDFARLDFELAPNPTHGELFIQTGEDMRNMRLTITDLAGRVVQDFNLGYIQGDIRYPLLLDIAESGTYILTVIEDGAVRASKPFILF